MKKLLLLVALWNIVGAYHLSAYFLVERNRGKISDHIVREQGYAYYFCNRGKCFAVKLNSQEKYQLIQILSPYSGKTVSDTLGFINAEPDLQKVVRNVLRDFKDFRKIDFVDTILKILGGA